MESYLNGKITTSYLSNHSDNRGSIFIGEFEKELPFLIQRVYYITNVPDKNIIRGHHAHKKLQQIMICVGGSCDIMFDDGNSKINLTLDKPDKAIYVKPGVWREMSNFTEKATLIVFASDKYDESDYIRNYSEFIKIYGGPQ